MNKSNINSSGGNDSLAENVALLNLYWNRSTFHDSLIVSIRRRNRRVVIELDHYYLALVDVTKYSERFDDELPSSWLYHSLELNGENANLRVEAEFGEFAATFGNLRLIAKPDLRVFIPRLDPWSPHP